MLKIFLLCVLLSLTVAIPDGWCDPAFCDVDPDCGGCGFKAQPSTTISNKEYTQKAVVFQNTKKKYLSCKNGKVVGGRKASNFQIHAARDGRISISTRGVNNKLRWLTPKKKQEELKCNGKTPYYFPADFQTGVELDHSGDSLLWKKTSIVENPVTVTAKTLRFTQAQRSVGEPEQISLTYENKNLVCKDGVVEVGEVGVIGKDEIVESSSDGVLYSFKISGGKYLTVPGMTRQLFCNADFPKQFKRLTLSSRPNTVRGKYISVKDGKVYFTGDVDNNKLEFLRLSPLYYFEADGLMILKPLATSDAMYCSKDGYLEHDTTGQIADKNRFTVTRVGNRVALATNKGYVYVAEDGFLKCDGKTLELFGTLVTDHSDATPAAQLLVLTKNLKYATLSGNRLFMGDVIDAKGSYFENVNAVLNAN